MNTIKVWKIHLLLNIAMYSYYLYLWIAQYFYTGKAGWKGFEIFMMTLFTAPIYLIYHAIALYFGITTKNKNIIMVTIGGILLCTLHIIAVVN